MKNPLFLSRRIDRLAQAICVLFACCALFSAPAEATDALDLRTGLKTLLQVTGPAPSSSLVAVLYNQRDPASEADAKAIAASINSGEVVPAGLKLTAQAMTISSFSWLSSVRAAFLAQGLPPESYADISRAAAATGAVTMSTDLACVKAGQCVLGIATKPGIQIYYSPAAAEASHINFGSAFVMLANQV